MAFSSRYRSSMSGGRGRGCTSIQRYISNFVDDRNIAIGKGFPSFKVLWVGGREIHKQVGEIGEGGRGAAAKRLAPHKRSLSTLTHPTLLKHLISSKSSCLLHQGDSSRAPTAKWSPRRSRPGGIIAKIASRLYPPCNATTSLLGYRINLIAPPPLNLNGFSEDLVLGVQQPFLEVRSG